MLKGHTKVGRKKSYNQRTFSYT